MSYEPEQLREWAEFVTWDEPDYRKPSVKEISAQLDAHADVLEERQELIEALRVMYESEKDYITRNKLGDPHDNQRMKVARALLARMDK